MIDVEDPGDLTVRAFGPTAHMLSVRKAPVPVGEPCAWCEELIAEGDSGIIMWHASTERGGWRAYHKECSGRQILGSVGHQRGLCTCDGGPGTMEDPPGLTKREAARAAVWEYARTRLGLKADA